MKKTVLALAAALAATLGASAQTADASTYSACVGEFETPGSEEIKTGAGSWWEKAPFQFYTKYSGIQAIYEADYLTGITPGDFINEVVFKYGDEGSFVYVEADLNLFIENTPVNQFDKKPDTDIYLWVDMDPTTSQSALDYEIELYYMEDEEIHFVLDKPLRYDGGNLLVTAFSEVTSGTEAQAMVTYAMKTDKPTTMAMGSDRESFLDCYDTGQMADYQGPNKYVPVVKFECTAAAGIGSVAADTDAPVQYFNLQGQPVDNPASGLYLRRQGTKTSKVIIK